MAYQVTQNDNNQVLMYVMIAAVIFFLFILPKIEQCNQKEEAEIKEKMSNLSFAPVLQKKDNILKVDELEQNDGCPQYVQWQPGPNAAQLPKVKGAVPNNFLGGTSGVCTTAKDMEYLSKKGGNCQMCG